MESDENWEDIHSQFSSLYPIKLFQWKVIGEVSEYWQRQLLKDTICHPFAQLYPPPVSYSRAFLKHIINTMENDGIEVIDDIYEAYTELMSRQDDISNRTFCYKNYIIDSENYFILKESVNLVSNGTTGLCTWQAALCLCEWIIENKDIFLNRVILELGSGLGLVGLLLLRVCQPKMVLFSDCHSNVIAQLIENVELNSDSRVTTEETANERLVSANKENCDCSLSGPFRDVVEKLACYRNSKLAILELDWESVTDQHLKMLGSGVDIIVASDVVYDENIIPALVRNLSNLLSGEHATSTHVKMALVCCTVRNSSTRDHFLRACQSASLKIEPKHSPQKKVFHYDRSTPIELIMLTK